MSAKDLIVDLATVDFDNIIADVEAIRAVNPQRHEMEHLTAIVYEDVENGICVGYKDVTDQEFWIRGHMPGMPLMPGVIMLEAAAQLCSYFSQKHDKLGAEMVGFGGLEDVRFRDPILPGQRLVLMGEFIKARRNRMIICRFQGVVGDAMCFEGILKGIPIPVEALAKLKEQASLDSAS